MTDIIERLREEACRDIPDNMPTETIGWLRYAADEIEKLRGREKILIQELEEVKEERDAAVADAERYRWLREGDYTWETEKTLRDSHGWLLTDSELDAAIDAARGEK